VVASVAAVFAASLELCHVVEVFAVEPTSSVVIVNDVVKAC